MWSCNTLMVLALTRSRSAMLFEYLLYHSELADEWQDEFGLSLHSARLWPRFFAIFFHLSSRSFQDVEFRKRGQISKRGVGIVFYRPVRPRTLFPPEDSLLYRHVKTVQFLVTIINLRKFSKEGFLLARYEIFCNKYFVVTWILYFHWRRFFKDFSFQSNHFDWSHEVVLHQLTYWRNLCGNDSSTLLLFLVFTVLFVDL